MEELLKYYSNLLIVQYNGKPKAKATISLLTWLIFVNLIFIQIRDAFDWKTAKGWQLDIIGKWVGVSRTYNEALYWDKKLLSYPNTASLVPDDLTDNLQHGYSDYESFDSDLGGFLTYEDLRYQNGILNDDDYRVVIGLKILKNNINHTAGSIDEAIWDYFGGQTYYSDQSLGVGSKLYNNAELTEVFGDIYNIDNHSITVIKNAEVINNFDNWSDLSLTFDIWSSSGITAAIYANNKFILAGNNGDIIYSTDGVNWSEPVSVNIYSMRALAYGANKYVGVGDTSSSGVTIKTSEDGVNWVTPTQDANSGLWDITYANGRFVAVGNQGYIVTSTDGDNWKSIRIKTSTNSYPSFTNITYGNGKFVAVSNGYYYVVSNDGINWLTYGDSVGDSQPIGRVITYGNNKFVTAQVYSAGGGIENVAIRTSTDGINWSQRINIYEETQTSMATVLKYYNGTFILCTSNAVYMSEDGNNWTIIKNNDFNHLCFGANKYLFLDFVNNSKYSECTVNYDSSEVINNFINSKEVNNIYEYKFGDVYTIWQPHTLIYEYFPKLKTIINVCEQKNVLPAPTGVEINLGEI